MAKDTQIFEGWTVQNFIDELEIVFPFVTFEDRKHLKKWCIDEQPYYKKYIPEVYNHFLEMALKLSKIDNV